MERTVEAMERTTSTFGGGKKKETEILPGDKNFVNSRDINKTEKKKSNKTTSKSQLGAKKTRTHKCISYLQEPVKSSEKKNLKEKKKKKKKNPAPTQTPPPKAQRGGARRSYNLAVKSRRARSRRKEKGEKLKEVL